MAQRSYPARDSTTTQSAPLGIKLLCGSSVVVGLVTIVGLIAALGRYNVGMVGVLVLAFGTGTLAVMAVVVYGLWTLQTWAWYLMVVFYTAGLLLRLIPPWSVAELVSILLTALFLAYLFHVRGYYLGS